MADGFQLFTSLRYDPVLVQVPSSNLVHAGWNRTTPSPLYMLDYHRDRMLQAATHWGWEAAVKVLEGDAGLAKLGTVIMDIIEGDQQSPRRVRVVITEDGELSASSSHVPETPLANLFPERLPPPGEDIDGDGSNGLGGAQILRTPEYAVSVDDLSATWSDHIHFKTTQRAVYDGARQRARLELPDLKEVLIISEADGAVMEGSITTPYFWREGRWVTPAVRAQHSEEKGIGGQNGTTRRWALEAYALSTHACERYVTDRLQRTRC